METIKGKARSLKFSKGLHKAVFYLDGKPVELTSPKSVVIEAGDDVVVAGNVKNGIFEGVSYGNLSKGVAFGKGYIVAAAVAFIAFPSSFGLALEKGAVAFWPFLAGVIAINSVRKQRKADRLILGEAGRINS